MFSNKEKTQKPKVMEINVVAKNTAIIGDIISDLYSLKAGCDTISTACFKAIFMSSKSVDSE